ncbi:uncharacterized protein [Triticum aestivum]|uniref:uncharacterized protein isoform X3 n=1 Tax=Triticum aestivum TaxID=4565 RepID=UPI001D02D0F3|nr:uncharacterized protein LOC123074389 isoform X3 [Triticum aestivum]
MASASPSWAILGSVPRVLAADADLPPGADLSLALPEPPRVAILTIPPRIFPGRTTSRSFPSVRAVDASGLLLLHADQGPAKGPTVIDLPSRRESCWRPNVAGYFVLDAKSASALPLPNPEYIMHPGHLGLIASPADAGHYMVAELQMILGGDRADLLCFSSEAGEWVTKDVRYPLPSRPFSPNGVVSHSGRLWWVDLSWCLLTCDPFADAPVLRVVPLPEGKALKSREAWGLLDKYRCVAVSGGKLRFVDMYRNRNSGGSAQIGVWTLADPDSTEWTLEYEATFTEIWDDASYKAIGLPRKIPVLALIHPTNPDVVYFFLDEHLLGVDVRARKVVECEVYELVAPPSQHVGTRFVHAWQLPQALCSDDDVTCPFQSSRVPKPVCKFFLTLQGCKNGNSCSFSHDCGSSNSKNGDGHEVESGSGTNGINLLDEINVFIRHGGPTLSLQVKLDEPSKLMMNTLRTRTRNYFADIYVCYGLKVIHPDHTLRSYGVLNNCTIKLSGRIRGGLPFTKYVADNKNKMMVVVRMPDGQYSLELAREGCLFIRSLICAFTYTFAKRKSWHGKINWDEHFKVVNGLVRISKATVFNLEGPSMQLDVKELILFI